MPAPAPAFPAPSTPRAGWRVDALPALLPAALLWALILLMVLPEDLDYGQLALAGAPEGAGIFSRLLWLGLLASSIALVAWRARLAAALLRALNPWLLVTSLLAAASVLWSIDPELSARRVYRLVTIVATCTAFVLVGWHAVRWQNVVRPVLTLLLAGSLAFGLALPALAIHADAAPELAGAWRGLANHKNSLGALAGIGAVFWAHAFLTRQSRALPVLAGGGSALACLLLSRSATATLAALSGVAILLFALRAPRRWLPWLATGVTVALLLVALGLLDIVPGAGSLLAPVAALTDKDGSLTGRTEIWAIVGEHVAQRPWLGSGYGAYWTAAPTPGTDSYAFVRRMAGFYPGSAHNGYLEVANDLGWLGLGGLLAYLGVHLRQALRLLRGDPAQAALVLALFVQQLVANLSETHWLGALSVDMVFMTLASVALARGLLQQRLAAAFGAPGRAAAAARSAAVLPR